MNVVLLFHTTANLKLRVMYLDFITAVGMRKAGVFHILSVQKMAVIVVGFLYAFVGQRYSIGLYVYEINIVTAKQLKYSDR